MTTLLAAMEDALLIVPAADDRQATQHLRDRRPECIAAAPDTPERILCGTFDAGLHRSTDGGETWTRVGADTMSDSVLSLATDPADPDIAWAGTEPSAVYRSIDGGATWTERPGIAELPSADQWYFPPRPHTHHVRWIEPDPADPERLYIGIEAGAFVITPDGGETWIERPPGSRRDNHSLATHPEAPGRVYAAAGDGYAESHDGGESWDHPQDGLRHRYCWSVIPDPGDPDTVVLSSANGPRTAHTAGTAESYLYRRENGTWEAVDGLPTGKGVTRAVLAAGGSAGRLFAANNRGLFRTDDAGLTWDSLPVEWPTRFTEQTVRGFAAID